MARLDRLEAAFVHVTDLLVSQSERMDVGFASLRGEISSLRDETRATREETRTMREALSDRLDRLIAITLKERTTGIERLASIEERLAKLERHVGV